MKAIALVFSSSLLLLLASCGTAPAKITPPPDPQPQPVSVPQAATGPDSEGFMTTVSGLRYKVLRAGPGNGMSPTRLDSVTVHYRGTLKDGTVFDSSYDRGEPTTFGVGQVIRGWTEALQLMKPGDKYLLNIPSYLAYGSRAVGDKIPPFSDLIFEVELLQIAGR
jgi:FKBP-type peptidyl-prolyl cis-trans isomerase FklB